MTDPRTSGSPGVPAADPSADAERLRRWRMVLGGDDADGVRTPDGARIELSADDAGRDDTLDKLYRTGARAGGLRVAAWLGDIRRYFPSSVVRVMQADAMDRLGLRQLLLEPETMAAVTPDLTMVTTLMGLGRAIPERSKESARALVRTVTDELERRLRSRTVQAVSGALDRAARTTRPRLRDVDWNRTIAANLRSYQPRLKTVIPERLIGFARRRSQVQREIVLCIDQSGSMADSIVYSSVFGAVLASMRSLRTRLVLFDTEIVDLTDELDDPVDVLFGVQLGGGTYINKALAYCQGLITQPSDTVLVLISDLYEGDIAEEMLRRARDIVDSGAVMVALLALTDTGHPSYDADHARALAQLGVPAFACTPDLFPELMAAAIERRDLNQWASAQGLDHAREAPDSTGSAP